MRHRNLRIILGGITLMMATLACSLLNRSETSVPELPNYGIFLVKDNSFVELKQYTGKPSNNSIQVELETATTTPTFWVWYPQMDPQYFMLVNLKRSGTGLPYKVTPKDAEGQILEIKPEKELNEGTYCFAQGDPFGSPFSTPYWCFKAGNSSTDQIPAATESAQDPAISNLHPTLTLDQEAITFRDEAMQAFQLIETMEYSIVDSNNSNGYGKATIDSMEENFYNENGDVAFQYISVGDMVCTKKEADWNCTQNIYSYSPLTTIKDILNGKQPIYHFTEGTSVSSGSTVEVYNGKDCRSFVVETLLTKDKESYTYLDKVCFDLTTHLPIYWITTYTTTLNNVATHQNITESFDFSFNIPVEIILP